MKIALAHDHLYQFGGGERVLAEMHRLYPQAPIHTLIHSALDQTAFASARIRSSYLQRFPAVERYFRWLLPLMPSAWERFTFENYDVVVSSSSAFVKGIIVPPNTAHICYCHTPTRYLWADSEEYVETLRLPRLLRWYIRERLKELRSWDQLAAQRPDIIIANSQHVAKNIKKYYKRDSHVIYPPVPVSEFHADHQIVPQSYFLIVSRLRPYKKVDLAIRAFNALRLPLVIIGAGEELSYLKKIAKSNITFLGEVSDEVKKRYLASCQALIHPQEEDFGITIVEAMASGRPVIAYAAGGALESLAPGISGDFFNHQTWEALADAVLHFRATDYDPELIRGQAERFDSRHFSQAIGQLVSEIYESSHH